MNYGITVQIFQFQYGLIKSLFIEQYLKKCHSQFQFQYGLIKSTAFPLKGNISKIFQFQYGLIKRIIYSKNKTKLMTFQFQYGLIKSKCEHLDKGTPYDFNSNMV